ncbi:MAG: FAD-dependent oxidoreductase [Lachnospiraceae bacterium]|nr:FAD-dependent oxidoreductase [Lachnospiraceae bacterium]
MIRINQLRLLVGNDAVIKDKIAKKLKLKPGLNFTYEIIKRSIDARKKPEIFYNYVIDVNINFGAKDKQSQVKFEQKLSKKIADPVIVYHESCEYSFPFTAKAVQKSQLSQCFRNNDAHKSQKARFGACANRPVIVGTGPAGLFCGYMLAEAGFRPLLLERGEAVEERAETVNRFWREGVLNPESNVQFGEGGAGTFSDGKLNTQVKDKDGIKKAVLSVFVNAGASKEILYEQKPHLGTDVLKKIIIELRKKIIANGGEIRFGQKVTGFSFDANKITGVIVDDNIEIGADRVVLAIGHSARDTFSSLYEAGIKMEAKPFAIGLRVEHPQVLINKAQYGAEIHELLGAADYKLVSKQNNPAVYSFCMCPGGFIVDASSEKGHLTINGMSYSDRAGKSANSAIVVTVNPSEFGDNRLPATAKTANDIHPLAGIAYQRRLEEKAYQIGGGKIPVQYLGDFRKAVFGGSSLPAKNIPSIKGNYIYAPVNDILDENFNKVFLKAMNEFGRQIPGFDDDSILLAGIESRTSSPIRILRDESCQTNYRGLYPCGEGAGYAGGIMSAAIDGVRVAEAVARYYSQPMSFS